MSLLHIVEEKYKNTAPVGNGWYYYTSKTPRHCFTYFIGEFGGKLFQVCIRDEFDQDLVIRFLNYVSVHSFEVEDIVKASIKEPLNEVFDALVILPSQFHTMYSELGPTVASKTLVIFPINHSEFSGTEKPAEIDVLRRSSVATLDWKRGICPKVSMSFENPKTQSKSGKTLKLANYSTLLHECECLSGVING